MSCWGYWRQRVDERLGDPPPSCNQELLVVRDKDESPREA